MLGRDGTFICTVVCVKRRRLRGWGLHCINARVRECERASVPPPPRAHAPLGRPRQGQAEQFLLQWRGGQCGLMDGGRSFTRERTYLSRARACLLGTNCISYCRVDWPTGRRGAWLLCSLREEGRGCN